MNDFQVSLLDSDETKGVTVLRIASAAKNSLTQFFSDRVQVSIPALEDLERAIASKLQLHGIRQCSLETAIQFSDDRTINCVSPRLSDDELKIQSLTQSITMRWSFIFDPLAQGNDHLYSVFVRISEHPNPGLIFQKFFSGHAEDIKSLDGEAFAPITCKVDFLEGRFSGELVAVIAAWVATLPKAESTFEFVNYLREKQDLVSKLVYATFPALMILSYIAVWLLFIPDAIANSMRDAAAWMVSAAIVFLLARQLANTFNGFFSQSLRKICSVPVFQVTAGDKQRFTKYLAKSQRSMITLAITGLLYGASKGVGLYLASRLVQHFFHP